MNELAQLWKPKAKASNQHESLGLAFFGLVLFMIVYFARPEDWLPGLAAVPLAKITGILMLVALVFSVSNIRWHIPREVIFLALLTVQLWLTVPFSPVWKGGAFNVMLDFSKVLPLVLVIYATVRSLRRLRWIFFVQAISVGAIAFASIIKAHMSSGRLEGVLFGISGNPNDLALIIDVTLPLCLALALTTRMILVRIAWSLAIVVMTYSVVLTASRAGAIAFAAAITVCLWELGVKRRRTYLLFLVPTAACVLWLFAGSKLEQRFQQTDLYSTTDNQISQAAGSAEQREELLIRSLVITAQHPLFGVGPGNFEIVSGAWHATHNSYTQVSAEGGIPALLFYLIVLWSAVGNLRNVRRCQKSGKGTGLFSMALEASLAAYLIGSFFGSEAYELFPYCLIASTTALRVIVRSDRMVFRGIQESQSLATTTYVSA